MFSDPHSGSCTCTGTCMGPSEMYRKKRKGMEHTSSLFSAISGCRRDCLLNARTKIAICSVRGDCKWLGAIKNIRNHIRRYGHHIMSYLYGITPDHELSIWDHS